MTTSALAGRLKGRGVWWAEYLVSGCPVLLAIDSHGDCIRRVRMREDVDEGLARAFLTGLLDHTDPVPPPRPPLRLVKPSSPPPSGWRFYLPPLRR